MSRKIGKIAYDGKKGKVHPGTGNEGLEGE